MRPATLFLLAPLTVSGPPAMAQDYPPPSTADWVYQNEVPRGLSIAAPGDVNGDGFGDILLSDSGYTAISSREGRVLLFLGSAAGPPATPDWIQVGSTPEARLFARGPVGDINGDGFDEILLSDGSLFMGSSAGPVSPPAHTAIPIASTDPGDVNGDGYGDLAVAKQGGADIYYGSAAGIPAAPSWSITGIRDGSRRAVLEDVTGDGYDDLIMTSVEPLKEPKKYTIGAAALHVWKGGPSGLGQEEPRVPRLPGPEQSFALAGAGDVNGDGHADLIAAMRCWDVSCEDAPPIVALYGSKSGVRRVEDVISGILLPEDAPVLGVGDVNGDGYDDAVASIQAAEEGHRWVLLVFFGSQAGFGSTPAVLRGEPFDGGEGDHFATQVGAGDINGDGYADILVRSVWPAVFAEGSSGRASLFLGRPDFGAPVSLQAATAGPGPR